MRRFFYSLLIIFLASLLFADSLIIPIREEVILTGRVRNQIRHRVLLRFPLNEIPEGAKATFGYIRSPNFFQGRNEFATVEVYRITRNWDRQNVRWEDFARPGEAYDTLYWNEDKTSSYEPFPIFLDITYFLQHWLENRDNYGLLLKRPYYENDGFGNEIERLREVLDNARVIIHYVAPVREE